MAALDIPRFTPIEAIVGPMGAAKTAELLARAELHSFRNRDHVVAVTHLNDQARVGPNIIKSRRGKKLGAHSLETSDQVHSLLVREGLYQPNGRTRVLLIDEGQFFDEDLARLAVNCQKAGIIVYYSGLDLYFNGEPWETSRAVLAVASKVTKLVARCTFRKCPEYATRTQMLIDRQPAPYNYHNRVVGDDRGSVVPKLKYTARCLNHWEVPGKPVRFSPD